MKDKCVIAICDDEKDVLKVISSSIQAAFSDKFESLDIHSFASTEKLDAFLNNNTVDILFMDIALPKCDGIQYALNLREKVQTTPVVFVTGAEERVWETFKVKPFGFVRKNHFLPDLMEVTQRFYNEFEKGKRKKTLHIVQKAKIHSIEIDSIKYIESSQRNQLIYLTGDEQPIEITGYTLASLSEELGPYGFYRAHKGYVINMRRVKLIATDGVYLKDDTFIPINKRNIGDFKTAYLNYSWENSVKLHV